MMSRLMIRLIRLYQVVLSPLMGNQCRFHPTCSAYAIEAIQLHGPWSGGFLAVKRILRCHPWDKGPWTDPVPKSCSGPMSRVGSQKGFGYKRGTQNLKEK